MACDLHLHSNCSDGVLSPGEVLALADGCGLHAAALTDHNTTRGIREFLDAAKGKMIEAVAGIEITTEWNGIERHLIGLWLSNKCMEDIHIINDTYHTAKTESNLILTERLRNAGYEITYDSVCTAAGEGNVPNRSHFARVLVDKGYFEICGEAFRTLLSERGGLWTPPGRIRIEECIDFLRQYGAVPVLAHPFQNFPKERLKELLTDAKRAGLLGVEVEYSEHTLQERNDIFRMSLELGLLPGGGSDFHGEAVKPGLQIGSGYGSLHVPDEWFEELKYRTGN